MPRKGAGIAHELGARERTADVLSSRSSTFDELALSAKSLDGLRRCGFARPSPVQAAAVPLGRCGLDLLVEAKSGTGKTVVFALVLLESLVESGPLQAIVLAPTREIAAQIGRVLRALGEPRRLGVEVAIGGTDVDAPRLRAGGFQALVGSPGRVAHLVKAGVVPTRSVRLLVLDEADKLAEESFQRDINRVHAALPDDKQVIATSATYDDALRDFLRTYMRSPAHVRPDSSSVLLGVEQRMRVVAGHANPSKRTDIKFAALLELLTTVTFRQCLVFCKYQARAQTLRERLAKGGWPADYMAGSQTQAERLRSLDRLQAFACRVLVATDLVARGVDAAGVDLVVNFDPPGDWATYLHRIGRSGRYGARGTAVTIVSPDEKSAFSELLASIGNLDSVAVDDPFEQLTPNEEAVLKSIPIVQHNGNTTEHPKAENGMEREDPYLLSLLESGSKTTRFDSFKKILLDSKKEVDPEPDLESLRKRLSVFDYVSSTYPKPSEKLPERKCPSLEEVASKLDEMSIRVANKTEVNHKTKLRKETIPNKRTSKPNRNKSAKVRYDSVENINIGNVGNEKGDESCDNFEFYEEVEDTNLFQQYLRWRRHLAVISAQIEQTVYMRTLLGTDF